MGIQSGDRGLRQAVCRISSASFMAGMRETAADMRVSLALWDGLASKPRFSSVAPTQTCPSSR